MSSAVPGRLSLSTAALLLMPPLMWAGNAVVGRLMIGIVPPFTLNFLRWVLVLLMLLPLAGWVLRPGSALWPNWRRFALMGALSVGSYNALQYLALETSSPLNVTLVASSMPVWMLLLGRLFFGVAITRLAAVGALLSLTGVAVVLVRGDLTQLLSVQFVPGDGWVLLAALCWSFYSWMLVRPPKGGDPADIKSDWAAFLLAQVVLGLAWAGLLSAGEWVWLPAEAAHIDWGWPLMAALLFVALGPSLLAYRCWGAGVARAGPATAAFFANLTPLFAGLLSTTLLGEPPHLYHAVGFALIVSGILVSSRR